MITRKKSNLTASAEISIPHNTDFESLATEHQFTIECSSDCNDGMTATLSIYPVGAGSPGDIEDGAVNCYLLAGKSITFDLSRRLLQKAALTIAGRTAGSVNLLHTPWNPNDRNIGHKVEEV